MATCVRSDDVLLWSTEFIGRLTLCYFNVVLGYAVCSLDLYSFLHHRYDWLVTTVTGAGDVIIPSSNLPSATGSASHTNAEYVTLHFAMTIYQTSESFLTDFEPE